VRILHILAEALLYYLACMLVARRRDEAPGLVRVIITVIFLAFISGGIKNVIGEFWLSNAIVFVADFVILWIGLGIGFFRTILAAVVVLLLRMLLDAVF